MGDDGDVDRTGGARVGSVVPAADTAPHSMLVNPPQLGSLQMRPLEITAVRPTLGAGSNATAVA
jgi:hypothetical protein